MSYFSRFSLYLLFVLLRTVPFRNFAIMASYNFLFFFLALNKSCLFVNSPKTCYDIYLLTLGSSFRLLLFTSVSSVSIKFFEPSFVIMCHSRIYLTLCASARKKSYCLEKRNYTKKF